MKEIGFLMILRDIENLYIYIRDILAYKGGVHKIVKIRNMKFDYYYICIK